MNSFDIDPLLYTDVLFRFFGWRWSCHHLPHSSHETILLHPPEGNPIVGLASLKRCDFSCCEKYRTTIESLDQIKNQFLCVNLDLRETVLKQIKELGLVELFIACLRNKLEMHKHPDYYLFSLVGANNNAVYSAAVDAHRWVYDAKELNSLLSIKNDKFIFHLKSHFPLLLANSRVTSATEPGWFPLIWLACQRLYHIAKQYNIPVEKYPRIDCIKEKWGDLRIYVSVPELAQENITNYDEYTMKVYEVSHQVSNVSSNVCEFCGNSPASKRNRPGKIWMKTVCDAEKEWSEHVRSPFCVLS